MSDQPCRLAHKMTSSVDEGREVDVTYFDFSKAFNTVSHNILICKRRKCG